MRQNPKVGLWSKMRKGNGWNKRIRDMRLFEGHRSEFAWLPFGRTHFYHFLHALDFLDTFLINAKKHRSWDLCGGKLMLYDIFSHTQNGYRMPGLHVVTISTMVEGEGFEPPVPKGTTVFKTVAFNHSANPPKEYFNSLLPLIYTKELTSPRNR